MAAASPPALAELHNGSSQAVRDLRLHCGDLRAHDRGTVPASSLSFDPPSLDELPTRTSRGIVVKADVSDETAAGAYSGVLVEGAPDVWLPIVLTVKSGPE